MIQVTKEKTDSHLIVRISGSIEESVNFDQLFGPVPAKLEVNCKEITRINSVAVKAWIKYFQSCQAKGIHLTFVECSVAIVEQLNLISNFACGGKVESLYVPFTCTSCRNELLGLFKTDQLKSLQYQLPPVKCPKCGNPAEFDDIAEEFFGFLMRE